MEMEALIDQTLITRRDVERETTVAAKAMPLRGYVDPAGVMVGESSGLVLPMELTPLPLDGLGRDEAQAQANAFEQLVNKLPRNVSFHAWMDREAVRELADSGAGRPPMVEELLYSRAIEAADTPTYRNRFFLALESHGKFGFGGPEVFFVDGLVAGAKACVTKDYRRRQELFWKFRAIFPGSEFAVANVLKGEMEGDIASLLKEGRRFAGALGETVKAETFSQEGAQPEVGLHAHILDPRESFPVIYGIGDARANGRAWANRLAAPKDGKGRLEDLPYLADLPGYLAFPKPDFAGRFGHRNRDGQVVHIGQFSVGGQPRKIYEVRTLPYELNSAFFGWLASFECPLTLRVRWEPYSESEKSSRLAQMKIGAANQRMTQKQDEVDLGDKAEGRPANTAGERLALMKAIQGGHVFGRLSILVALSGVEGVDSLGRPTTASENLHTCCNLLEEHFQKHDIEYAEETEYQDMAFMGLFPGCISAARLGHMDCTSDVFAAVMPMHDHYVPQVPITDFEHKGTYLMTVDRSGRRTSRSLATGKIMSALVVAGMGRGKSFFLNQVASGFRLTHEKAMVDVIERGESLGATALALGGASIPMGDPSRTGTYNPFDVPVGPDGYGPEDLGSLTVLVQACLGLEDLKDDEKSSIHDALVELGLAPLAPGEVRSLNMLCRKLQLIAPSGKKLATSLAEFRSDLDDQVGPYGWVFPAVKNEADSEFVVYTFPVTPKDAVGEALQMAAILQKIGRRVDATHPHLLIVDEAHSVLDVTVENLRRRVAAHEMGRTVEDAYTMWRKLGGGVVLCTQQPGHLMAWRPSLAESIKRATGTWVVMGLTERSLEEFRAFGASEAVIRAAMDLQGGRYEHLMVQGGIPWIQRTIEGTFGKALNETAPEPNRVKRYLIEKGEGSLFHRLKLFERAMGEVKARVRTWPEIERLVRAGEWK